LAPLLGRNYLLACGDKGTAEAVFKGTACGMQLKEQLNALQSSTGNAEAALLAQMQEKSKALAELQGMVKETQQELDRARASNETLVGEKARLEQAHAALAVDRQEQNVAGAQMAAEMQEKNRTLEQVVAQLAQLRGEREALDSSSKDQDEQIQELLEALKQMQAQARLSTEQNVSLKAKLDAAEQGLENERQRLGTALL
jgi:chromosome segregation ATPase